MSVKSTIIAVGLIGAMIPPAACLAQGGGAASPPAPATEAPRPAPAVRPVLPPAPAQNGDMTWDGDHLRPNNYRITHPMYPRPRTALTPFDVRLFSGVFAYDGYYDPGCCLVRRDHYGRRVLRVRG